MKRERKKSNIFFRRRVMRQLIQATGRLSRSFLKCPEIHIFVSSSVLSSIDPKEMREHPLTTEQLAVARLAGKYYTADKDEAFCKLLNDAENINAKAMTQILRLLNEGWKNGWTSEMIKIWAKMRELALRFPTFEEIPDEFKDSASLFYFQRPEDHSLQYFFASRNDYGRGTVISFNREIEDFLHFLEKDGDDSLIPQKMDEAGSRLDVMLKVPGFREYMESHGYRTEFGNGRYVITPAFYNNVYKGALGEIFCEFFSKSLAIRFTESKRLHLRAL